MEKKSWVCTLITQLSLCFGLFVVLNLGRPRSQKPIYQKKTSERAPLDIYFITVRGGSRPLKEQAFFSNKICHSFSEFAEGLNDVFGAFHEVEKVVKKCKVEFVVNISELGEKDPLRQNGMRYFESLTVPWYCVGTQLELWKRQGADNFLKQVKIPSGKTLDLIPLETGSLQDPSSGTGSDQFQWLTRILEASSSNWRIVVGFHPMEACNKSVEQDETKQVPVSLYNIFRKYGVNAYLSGQDCTRLDKGRYFTPINQRLVFYREIVNGFLLHRVSSLELVTYFISLTGEVVHKMVLQQQRKEFV